MDERTLGWSYYTLDNFNWNIWTSKPRILEDDEYDAQNTSERYKTVGKFEWIFCSFFFSVSSEGCKKAFTYQVLCHLDIWGALSWFLARPAEYWNEMEDIFSCHLCSISPTFSYTDPTTDSSTAILSLTIQFPKTCSRVYPVSPPQRARIQPFPNFSHFVNDIMSSLTYRTLHHDDHVWRRWRIVL